MGTSDNKINDKQKTIIEILYISFSGIKEKKKIKKKPKKTKTVCLKKRNMYSYLIYLMQLEKLIQVRKINPPKIRVRSMIKLVYQYFSTIDKKKYS